MSIELQTPITPTSGVAAFPWLDGRQDAKKTNGVLTNGHKSNGVMSNGVASNGIKSDSRKRDFRTSEDGQTSENSKKLKLNTNATAPNSAITNLLDLLQNAFTDEAGRKQLYDAAINLAWSIESQQDTAQRLYHGHMPLSMAQVGLDTGLFKFLSSSPDNAYSVEALAMATGTDSALLERLLRFYASQSMVQQKSDGTFTASNITHNLSFPGTDAGIKHYSLTMTPVYNIMPKYFAKHNYKNPTSSPLPFNMAYNTDMPVFEWRKHNPENAKVGQAFMAAQRMGQRSVWDGQAPIHHWQMSEHDLSNGRVMMCDVGGGFGHQCIDFRKHNPDLKGHIVTEDLALVHNMIPEPGELEARDIELVEHDFTKAQPIHGAKVYYLRNVIHNWNDEASENIISQISKVMAEDSVLILDDVVLPEVGATWKQASMDLAMLAMLGAMERTEEHFAKLLAKAGLKLRELHTYDQDYRDTLIVAELPGKTPWDSPQNGN